MKKLISLMLALIMVFSLATVASAKKTEDYADKLNKQITFTKNYVVNSGKAPAETFDFSQAEFTKFVNNVGEEATSTSHPTVTIDDAVFSDAMPANDKAYTASVTIDVSNYQNCELGEYYYTISEVVPETGKTAGGNYEAEDMTLVVTVLRDTSAENADIKFVAAVLYADDDKTSGTTNTYDAGTLAVTKTVTGNMGDQDELFTFTVSFAAKNGYSLNSEITYSGAKSGTVSDGTVTLQLKHGDTVTFENVPYDVEYTVTETVNSDYETSYKLNKGNETIGYKVTDEMTEKSESVEIINNRDVGVETGIITDSAPYVILIAVCAVAAVAFVLKRRNAVEF